MATAGTAYEVAELAPGLPFGATVRGLARDQLADPAVRQSLVDLWTDKGVLLFRDGETSREMQVELSAVFGELTEFPFKESRSEDDPRLVKIKYFPDDGSCYEVNGELIGGWIPWHTDMIYFDKINRGGILRPVQLPPSGGQTGFLDQISAWESLPQELRERIEGLHVVYTADINYANAKFGRPESLKFVQGAASFLKIMRRQYEYPRVIHPAVYTQAETGRKVLNVSPGFSDGIFEMGGPEGEALLAEVIDHCVSQDGAYFHDWEEGDMVLWDNWRVLHCAAGVPADATRIMERTNISGDYALGRALDGNRDNLPTFDV
ncbi:MAG: TauD/TfdA family dioxygenase [Sphingomonadaceae bacterium]